MSAFLNGADCGPVNPLKSASGRLDVDRSIFRDRLISKSNVAGPSRTSQQAANPSAPQTQRPFDLSSLRDHLNVEGVPRAAPRPAPFQSSNWAEGFVPQTQPKGKQREQQHVPSPWGSEFRSADFSAGVHPSPAGPSYQTRAPLNYGPPAFQQQGPYMPFQPHPQLDTWFEAGPSRPYSVSTVQPTHLDTARETIPERSRSAPVTTEPLNDAQEVLAQTAQSFIQELEGSSASVVRDNPKLGQSKFMELVNAIGRREVVVREGEAESSEQVGEGAKLVERGGWVNDFMAEGGQRPGVGATAFATANPTHGPIAAPQLSASPSTDRDGMSRWEDEFARATGTLGATSSPSKSVRFIDPQMSSESMAQEFDQDTFADFNGRTRQARTPRIGIGALESWDDLEKDRESLSTMRHLRGMGVGDQTERYLFQSGNPFVAGAVDIDTYRQESPTIKGVLELEAAVQTDPQDHGAWYALGLKQQENEREDQAILALSKAVQLQPEHRPTYLALAVSYTNEGDPGAANVMLEKWLDLGQGITHKSLERHGESLVDERQRLIERLIDVARSSPEDLDPDVQIALGVLFNSAEDYLKAEDCFTAALSVRPDDWLLYNRLGATLANSGRSNEAIHHYHKALTLHPNFVRALFNLGIAYVNLSQYTLAGQRILDALRLQHADATEGYVGGANRSVKGITSDVLWTTLRSVCMHLGRLDLVELATNRNLQALFEGFPSDIDESQHLAGFEQQITR